MVNEKLAYKHSPFAFEIYCAAIMLYRVKKKFCRGKRNDDTRSRKKGFRGMC